MHQDLYPHEEPFDEELFNLISAARKECNASISENATDSLNAAPLNRTFTNESNENLEINYQNAHNMNGHKTDSNEVTRSSPIEQPRDVKR